MDIIFQGKYTSEEMNEHFMEVLRLLQKKYDIQQFREIHVSLTLMDARGGDVELVDSQTDEVYRIFEVGHKGIHLTTQSKSYPVLQLVVDNTRKSS